MAITRLVVGYQEYPKNIKYPILARWKPDGEIFLFGKDSNGLLIESSKPERIGMVSDRLHSITNSNWEILPIGTKLTIKNTL